MPYFCDAKGGRISEVSLPNSMDPGADSVTVGISDYQDVDGKDLQILAPPYVSVRKGLAKGNILFYEISSYHPGTWTLDIYTQSGKSLGQLKVSVPNKKEAAPVASPASAELKEKVMNAVRAGSIKGITGQLTAATSNGYFSDGTHRIYLADGMYYVLAALANSNPVEVMSMMRFGQGYHGDTAGRSDGSALCSAIDIQAYAGFRFNLINGENVDTTINAVVKLFDNLPPGSYGFGLTRPSLYPKGPPMPDKDVFLPCNTSDWPMYKWGTPLSNPTPQFKNAAAAAAVSAAMGRNTQVKVAQMFMDGPDHLHLHVWSASA